MSDPPQGEGWWEASDSKWYPPESHPDYRPPPSPPAPKPAPPTPAASRSSGWKKWVIVGAAGLILLGIIAAVVARDDSGWERTRAVNVFIRSVSFENACTSKECDKPKNFVPRYSRIRDQAAEIPGDDIAEFRDAVVETWTPFEVCIATADVIQECDDQMFAFIDAYTALYHAVR